MDNDLIFALLFVAAIGALCGYFLGEARGFRKAVEHLKGMPK